MPLAECEQLATAARWSGDALAHKRASFVLGCSDPWSSALSPLLSALTPLAFPPHINSAVRPRLPPPLQNLFSCDLPCCSSCFEGERGGLRGSQGNSGAAAGKGASRRRFNFFFLPFFFFFLCRAILGRSKRKDLLFWSCAVGFPTFDLL